MRGSVISKFKEDSPAASQMRRAIRNIKMAVNGIRSILITSPARGDGKSLITSLLALTLARDNPERHVLIIDCDMRKPSQHLLFNISRRPGLSELLVEMTDMDEACRETEMENLWLIPSGGEAKSPEQLLSSPRVSDLVRACRTYFDFIVCDSPPVLPANDAILVGTHLDGVALVVRAYKTQRGEAKKALELLRSSGIKIFGLIANDIEVRGYYGYES
ncbi:CpsD/CapB family tyrosine-protein kinase [Candidatus Poribacteria bacterium]|nr:CpsD/CapB family tyrosine-protein kinase [Candidatus Poribacteria bacterium]HDO76670.1 polysaccharide biosynthesis tyrosine autokinase [Candidatus Poribacteria bacterium]HEX30275.1 polysaccharide biosynthesis tyrosine autokinase [Candidatus Poribacteria bacterium]